MKGRRIVYLHGFASGPASKKARLFADRCREFGLRADIPDLARGDFRGLTLSGQLDVIARCTAGEPVSLVGSSMGGYLAALFAARHPEVERVVLMAPAFGFARRWADRLGPGAVRQWEQTGALPVMHYGAGEMQEVGWGLMEDARKYEEEPEVRQPVLIFHGRKDDVVPLQASEQFAAQRPNVMLRALDSDHELWDVVETIWAESRDFLTMDGARRG